MMSLRSGLGALFMGTCSLCLLPTHAQEQQEAGQVTAPYLRPTGPIVVTYDAGELTIQAFNAPLADVLRAVTNHIGVLIAIPPGADEPVIGVFGPGSPRSVLAALLNGSRFNYVMTGSSSDGRLQQLLLTVKTDAHEKAPRENKQQVIASASQTVAADSAAVSENPLPIASREQVRAEMDALIAEASANAAAEAAALGENGEGHSSGIEQLRQLMETALKQADNMATDSSVQEWQPSQSAFGGSEKQTNGTPRTRRRTR
jgi:hypothetical protein